MLRIAKILKSNGIDGGLLVSAPEVDLETIEGPVLIEFDGLPAPFFIEECTPRGTTRYLIRLTDVSNLKDAEEMVGRDIWIDAEESSAEEYDDFVGWTVFDRGVKVGTVSDYEPIPGNLCLYVTSADGSEIMIPLHEDFVLSVDQASQSLDLDLPAGLY